jgi:hypothetical protein
VFPPGRLAEELAKTEAHSVVLGTVKSHAFGASFGDPKVRYALLDAALFLGQFRMSNSGSGLVSAGQVKWQDSQ